MLNHQDIDSIAKSIYASAMKETESTHQAYREDSPIGQLPLTQAALILQASGQEEELGIALKKFLAMCSKAMNFYRDFQEKTGINKIGTVDDIRNLRDYLENRTGFFKRMALSADDIQAGLASAVLQRNPLPKAASTMIAANPKSIEDFPSNEKNVALRMMDKGYMYVAQIVTDEGNFGDPLYFKSADEIGPLLRSIPDYKNAKMLWGFKIYGKTHPQASSEENKITATEDKDFMSLPATERAVARKMKGKGYLYLVQIETEGEEFGLPLYFKSANEIGPFLRGFPDYQNAKTKWVLKLDEIAD